MCYYMTIYIMKYMLIKTDIEIYIANFIFYGIGVIIYTLNLSLKYIISVY